ncbi:hypothetical protein BGZ63DRAFT_377716 [Mariannaea sp. PMI_226]|nr:hypothetical protein BGZ63DRAFT_377716 [Mariannaea sp. PMI_226]
MCGFLPSSLAVLHCLPFIIFAAGFGIEWSTMTVQWTVTGGFVVQMVEGYTVRRVSVCHSFPLNCVCLVFLRGLALQGDRDPEFIARTVSADLHLAFIYSASSDVCRTLGRAINGWDTQLIIFS